MLIIIGLSGILVTFSWLIFLAACMRSSQLSRMEEIRWEAENISQSETQP